MHTRFAFVYWCFVCWFWSARHNSPCRS
jgi:hypothetical protein